MTDNNATNPAVVVTNLEGRGPLNLLGKETFLALMSELDRLDQDRSVRALILTGSGERAFSAGVDLHQMKDLNPEDAEAFIMALHGPARKLLTMAIPAIAAVRGPCLGGALELILACDIRIAAEDAILGLPEVQVGIPSVIEASLLPPTIGLGRARWMLLTPADGCGPRNRQHLRRYEPGRAHLTERHRGQVAGVRRGRISRLHHQRILPHLHHRSASRGDDRVLGEAGASFRELVAALPVKPRLSFL